MSTVHTIPPAHSRSHHTTNGGCRNCGGRRFHRSTLRSFDFIQLLGLRYPVRCVRCSQRQYVDFLTASLVYPTKGQAQSRRRPRQNWRQWTSGSDAKTIEKLFGDDKPDVR